MAAIIRQRRPAPPRIHRVDPRCRVAVPMRVLQDLDLMVGDYVQWVKAAGGWTVQRVEVVPRMVRQIEDGGA